MKKTIFLPVITLILCIFSSCKTLQYVPVETTKIEYRDNFTRDSIFQYDSTYVKEKGDTIFLEKYKYLYRDKIVLDSVLISDTIRVPYPVDVVKEVEKPLSGWQNFQIWCGRIALVVALLIIIYIVLKMKKKIPF